MSGSPDSDSVLLAMADSLEKLNRNLDAGRRDSFAMAALAGILANPSNSTSGSTFARAAYVLADEMLEARTAKPDADSKPEPTPDSDTLPPSFVALPVALKLARRCLANAFLDINRRGPVGAMWDECRRTAGEKSLERAFRVLGGLMQASRVQDVMFGRLSMSVDAAVAHVYSDEDIVARLEEIAE